MTPVSDVTALDTIWFESDRFSTYVVIATDAEIDPSTLNTLRLQEGLTRVEDKAFTGGAFEAVIIPDSCVYIGHEAFANCPNQVYISCGQGTFGTEADAFPEEIVPVVRCVLQPLNG